MTQTSHEIGAGSSLGGSLLEPDQLRDAQGPEKPKSKGTRERWDRRLDAALRRRAGAAFAWWWNRKRIRWGTMIVLPLVCATIAYFALRPTPQPDYATAPMDEVLGYTLLEDDFNLLPIDERLGLMKDLIERLKTMGSGDSVLMAQFAAMIEGDLREKMMKNASKLVLDVWDKYALDYTDVPLADRGEFLDNKFLELTKMMESLAGVESKQTDEERLKDVREQAARDEDMFESGRGPDAGAMAFMTTFLRNGLGQHSSPQQQQRGQQLMRDMTRHFRGRNVETGR